MVELVLGFGTEIAHPKENKQAAAARVREKKL